MQHLHIKPLGFLHIHTSIDQNLHTVFNCEHFAVSESKFDATNGYRRFRERDNAHLEQLNWL